MLQSPDLNSPAFPEFGRPRGPDLLDEAKELYPRRISGPNTAGVNWLENDRALMAQVFPPIEFQQSSKGEDRIFAGFVTNEISTPVLMVADGASETITSSGQTVSTGGEAAHTAILSSLEVLSERLRNGLDPLEVDDIMRDTFDHAVEKLQEKKVESGTTLLLAFPYVHTGKSGKSVALWHYGYVGDGRLTLISPSRKVDGHPLSTSLLSPQKLSSTATVLGSGMNVDPMIGTVRYSEGDMMIAASDGIDGPASELLKEKHFFLSNFVEREIRHNNDAGFSRRIAEALRGYRFSDDAVMSIMNTSVSTSKRT